MQRLLLPIGRAQLNVVLSLQNFLLHVRFYLVVLFVLGNFLLLHLIKYKNKKLSIFKLNLTF